jgi:hypothetical protein
VISAKSAMSLCCIGNFAYMTLYAFCDLVLRAPGYRSRGPDLFPTLPDFLRSSGSGTGSTQSREYN